MNYDRNKVVVEIEKLYHDGRKLVDNFIHTFEKNRGAFTEGNELAHLAFLPYERGKAPSISPKIQAKADEYE